MDIIYLDKNEELTSTKLSKIIRYHQQHVLPVLKENRGYYDGTGQAINTRVYDDPSKPNNRIVKNYCKSIVENYRGYICGVPITYSNDDNAEVLSRLLKENDVINSDSEWLKNALIYGYAPQLCYINEKQEYKFRNILPEQVIPIYSADLDEELLYCIYYYPIVNWDDDAWSERYSINLYDKDNIYHYEADSSISSITISTQEVEPHYFGEVPFSIFYLTDDAESIFSCIISLQDAYNKLVSDSVNDWESFVDAYMVLKNITADADDIAAMKENRILMLDDDADAAYLTKSSTDTQVLSLLEEINTAIHTISCSPDFNSAEFNGGVSSGVAIQYKLVGFNNLASNIEAQFRKALTKRFDLLNNVFALLDSDTYAVDITFTHNLPADTTAIADNITKLRGLVSDRTLLSQVPFVHDVNAELEYLEEQNSLTDLYDFNELKHVSGDSDGEEE